MIRQIPQLRVSGPNLLIVGAVEIPWKKNTENMVGFMSCFNDGVVDCIICPKCLLTLSVGTFHVGEL